MRCISVHTHTHTGVEMVIAKPNGLDILKGSVVPSLPPGNTYFHTQHTHIQTHDAQTGTTTVAVAMVGAIIMPHNIYLHSALVQSRGVNPTERKEVMEGIFYHSLEAAIALVVSFFINMFVVSVFSEVCLWMFHFAVVCLCAFGII